MTSPRLLFLLLGLMTITIQAWSATDTQVNRVRGGGGRMKARSGPFDGEHSVSLGLALLPTVQGDLNNHIDGINQTAGTDAEKFRIGKTWDEVPKEISFDYQYRLGLRDFGFVFRPSLFSHSTSGGGYDYSLSGTSFFIMEKLWLAEGDKANLFLLGGFGYGTMQGTIKQPNGQFDFDGQSYGTQVGIGSEYCPGDTFCWVFELSYRSLTIPVNTVTTGSGTVTGFSQANIGQELEYQGTDLKTQMGGMIVRVALLYPF